jgi:hypothetical protein
LGCRPPVLFSSTWIRLIDAAEFRFLAEPNTSTTTRDAIIAIGETSFFVRQGPPAQPGLAAAPGSLVFGLDKRGKTDTKRITAWTEYGSHTFTARAGHPWLSVTPRRSKDERQVYDVTVRQKAGLGPGRYDTFVELTPGGSTTASLRIPVVVEVPGTF